MIYLLYYLAACTLFALGYGIGHYRGMVRGEKLGRVVGEEKGWNEGWTDGWSHKITFRRIVSEQFAARKGRN